MLGHIRCQRMVEMGESKQRGGAKGSARRRKMTMMKGMMASVCVGGVTPHEMQHYSWPVATGHKPLATGLSLS